MHWRWDSALRCASPHSRDCRYGRAPALIASHAAARVTPGFVINAMRYAGDTAAMKVSYADTPVHAGELWFALITVVLARAAARFRIDPSVLFGTLCSALRWPQRSRSGRAG